MAIPVEVQTGQLTVRGLSLGGVETVLQIPQLDLLFDVGHCPRSFAGTSRLFLTHGHADHAGGLVNMLSLRLLLGMRAPLKVFAPAPITGPLRRAVEAYAEIQGLPFLWELTALGPDDEVSIAGRNLVRPFVSQHVIPTLGYTVWENVDKLLPQFRHLAGPEIGRRKRAGDDLFERVARPIVSFCGDTRIETLDMNPHLYRSRVLILEATYVDERRTPAQCTEHGHVHLDQILERAALFENEHLVLTHFSQSYRPMEVHEIVRRRTAGRLRPEVHVFAPEGGSWPG